MNNLVPQKSQSLSKRFPGFPGALGYPGYPFKNTYRLLNDMKRGVEQIFDDINDFGDVAYPTSFASLFPDEIEKELSERPVCEIEDMETHYFMTFDLPGVKKEDLKVELRDQTLVVSGQRKEEMRKEDRHMIERGRSTGKYYRAISLPYEIETKDVESTFADGVLRVAIPKRESDRSQMIKVLDHKPGFWDKLMKRRRVESAAEKAISAA